MSQSPDDNDTASVACKDKGGGIYGQIASVQNGDCESCLADTNVPKVFSDDNPPDTYCTEFDSANWYRRAQEGVKCYNNRPAVPTRYDCKDGTCETSATGTYSDLAACEADCKKTPPLTYDCGEYTGDCMIVRNGNGKYTTFDDCKANCVAPAAKCKTLSTETACTQDDLCVWINNECSINNDYLWQPAYFFSGGASVAASGKPWKNKAPWVAFDADDVGLYNDPSYVQAATGGIIDQGADPSCGPTDEKDSTRCGLGQGHKNTYLPEASNDPKYLSETVFNPYYKPSFAKTKDCPLDKKGTCVDAEKITECNGVKNSKGKGGKKRGREVADRAFGGSGECKKQRDRKQKHFLF